MSGRALLQRSIRVIAPERAEPTLAQLAARAQLGDTSTLEPLLQRLAGQLRPHIEHLTGDGDRAQDVLQEVLLLVAKKLPGLREHRWVRAWAYRIATREALRHISSERRVAFTSIESASAVPAPEPLDESTFDPDTLARLPKEVAALPAASRIVIQMHYLDGLTQPEVAEALGIPLGTVKSRIAYGLQQLRVHLCPDRDDDLDDRRREKPVVPPRRGTG